LTQQVVQQFRGHARDMPDYLRISQALFTQDANVRNVKAFFATKRAKFTTTWPVIQPSVTSA